MLDHDRFWEQGERFFVFVRCAQEYQNQMKICGSRRCRATDPYLYGAIDQVVVRGMWLVRLRLHPTPKKRDPKTVGGFLKKSPFGLFLFVSRSFAFRKTFCELATDNSGVWVSIVFDDVLFGRVGHTDRTV